MFSLSGLTVALHVPVNGVWGTPLTLLALASRTRVLKVGHGSDSLSKASERTFVLSSYHPGWIAIHCRVFLPV
jgi:hypothetical protein